MTLCVAASCSERGKARIVIGSDWKEENESAGAEIQNKLYWIDDNWPVLVSGTLSRALELILTYRQYFAKLKKANITIDHMNIIDHVKRPPLIQKRKLIEEVLGASFGISFNRFLRHGKDELPEGIRSEILHKIGDIELGCDVILMTFIPNIKGEQQDYLFKVCSEDCSVEVCDNFAAVGSGSDIAEPVLYRHEHNTGDPIGKSIYHVYEAMKLGSKAPGVGEEFAISLLSPQRRGFSGVILEGLRDSGKYNGFKFMENKFKQYGPKDFVNFGRFNRLFLDKPE